MISILQPSARSAPPKHRRAGLWAGSKCFTYSAFMASRSEKSARITSMRTTWSISEPYFSRIIARFFRVCRVSAAMSPGTSSPVSKSSDTRPERNRNLPSTTTRSE